MSKPSSSKKQPVRHAPPAKVASGGLVNHPVVISLVLVAVTLVVFWPVMSCGFINADDPEYFSANPHVQNGFSWEQIKWAFGTVYFGNWLPLTWLSLMLDGQLFGAGAAGPHFTNLLLHAANAVLVFLLVRRLTGAVWRSAFVAGLFAWHPLHVESVAWVAERRDVLCAFFGLLSLIFYVRYASLQARGDGREVIGKTPIAHRLLPLALSLLFFTFGLMSKAMVVTIPCVMLLLDFWPLKRVSSSEFRVSSWVRLVVEKVPFFAMSIALSAITFFAQHKAGAVSSLERLSLGDRVGNALVSYARYLGKTFWPVDLALPYPHPGHWPVEWVTAAAVLVAALCVGALWFGRKYPFVTTGWFWFFGMLIPAIGLIQTGSQAMADRFTYLPHVGLFIGITWVACGLFARWQLPVVVVRGAALAVLTACVVLTAGQLKYWKNSETLFRHTIAVTKNNAAAHNGLGVELMEQERLDEAMEQYQLALQINPTHGQTLNNLGNLLARKGRFAEAIRCFEMSLPANSDPSQVHNNLANALAATGKMDEALAQFRLALDGNPDFADAHNNLGNALAMKGSLDEAIIQYREALRCNPNLVSAHGNFGYALALQNKFDEAVPRYTEALRLDPANPRTHYNLGYALARLGRREKAVAELSEALRLQPQFPEAKNELRALGVQLPE